MIWKRLVVVILLSLPFMLSALVTNPFWLRVRSATPSVHVVVAYRLSTAVRIPRVKRRSFSCRCFMSSAAENSHHTFTKTLVSGSHQPEHMMEVKKSKFLGYAQHVETWNEAQECLKDIKTQHPKARHVCFGFVAGENPVIQERCSDDGEPTGTAGLPILGAIKGEGLSDVVCVVVRYFGGVKLGAGGLIRAYGGAARLVLRDAPKETLIPKTSFRILVSSSNAGTVYDAAAKVGGVVCDEEYTVDGDFLVTITCEAQHETRLREKLTDATRGNVNFLQPTHLQDD